MKVLIISGFLGAGKTTFIKELVNRTGRDIAIFENEYAAEGVDKSILEDGIKNGEVNIFELEQGCICCSTKGDFKASVLTIANSVDPEILIVEPTGIGMLSNVIANIKELEYDRIKLLDPVTIVDIHSIERYHKEYKDLFEDQIKGSSMILLSKSESSDSDEKTAAKKLIEAINPGAEVVTQHYSGQDNDFFNKLLNTELEREIQEREEDPENMPENFSLEGITFASPGHLIVFMEDLVRGEYGDIIRAKGHVDINGETFRFESADRTYYITGGSTDKSSAAFIGHCIRRQELRRKLLKVNSAAGNISSAIKKDMANLFKNRAE